MECPYCGSADLKVLDSRPSAGVIRRRRECERCERRFTTYEQIASPDLKVTKRDKRSEDFDRRKLIRSVERVTRGRPVAPDAREALVRGMEAELFESGQATISSWQLAEKLHGRLLELDAIAANRFAANYIGEDGVLRMTPAEARPQLALPFGAAPAPEKAARPDDARRRTTRGKRAK